MRSPALTTAASRLAWGLTAAAGATAILASAPADAQDAVDPTPPPADIEINEAWTGGILRDPDTGSYLNPDPEPAPPPDRPQHSAMHQHGQPMAGLRIEFNSPLTGRIRLQPHPDAAPEEYEFAMADLRDTGRGDPPTRAYGYLERRIHDGATLRIRIQPPDGTPGVDPDGPTATVTVTMGPASRPLTTAGPWPSLNAWLIDQGLARAEGPTHADGERAARRAQRGMWDDRMLRPDVTIGPGGSDRGTNVAGADGPGHGPACSPGPTLTVRDEPEDRPILAGPVRVTARLTPGR